MDLQPDPTRPTCPAPHRDADRLPRFRDRLCGAPLGKLPMAVHWTRRLLLQFDQAGIGVPPLPTGEPRVCLVLRCAKCGAIPEFEVLQPAVALALATAEARAENDLQLVLLELLKDEPLGLDSRRLLERIEPRPSQQRVLGELRALAGRGAVKLMGRTRGARWVLSIVSEARNTAQYRAIRRNTSQVQHAQGVAA